MDPARIEKPRFEVADIFRAHADDHLRHGKPSRAQTKVMRHIIACRTASLGWGHRDLCGDCGLERISYNSCGDRHCPKCQSRDRVEWIDRRMERILPVGHFHVVLTLPDLLRPLALHNQKLIYDLLFVAGSQSLMELARDPTHLGATIGITGVLHTWTQELLDHPHLHFIVTAGGLSLDGQQWLQAKSNGRFLVPVKVLGKLFRGKFLDGLEEARKAGKLAFRGTAADLEDPCRWATWKNTLYDKKWNTYAKRPFGGTAQIVRYLGNYTHRVAISNHRIVAFKDGLVTFTARDPEDPTRKRKVTLEAREFIRRFLLHVLPKGFIRIRHFGLYAGRQVALKLPVARRLLEPPVDPEVTPTPIPCAPEGTPPLPDHPKPWWERFRDLTGVDVMLCPRCRGRMVRHGGSILPDDDRSNAPPQAALAAS
jgi:hypothetical protein